MHRKNYTGLFAVILVIGIVVGGSQNAPEGAPSYPPIDPRNARYEIDGKMITLRDGAFEEPIPNSDRMAKTFIIQAVEGDLDRAFGPDYAAILVHQPGEKGTFYYLYALMSGPGEVLVTKPIVLGSRVRPTSLQIVADFVELNYLERAPNEPDTAEPTLLRVVRHRVAGEPPELKPAQ